MADKNYVGYVKREADSFVDWASISKSLSDTLTTIVSDRDKQRTQIQQQTDELVKSINDVELGQNTTFNQNVLDGAAQSTQAALSAYKEFTSGRLKQPAYARFKQTLKDEWAQYDNVIKTYNEKYTAALKKVEDGTMSAWGAEAFKKDADFLNYQKYKIYTNPVSGRLALAGVDQDGKIITDPSKMLSVNNIANIYSDQPGKFKIDAFTNKVADKAGQFKNAQGNVTIEDAIESPRYKAYEKAEIDAIIQNSPRDVASILTDFSGEEYDVIFDSKAYDGLSQSQKDKTILLERDGNNMYQPKMTDPLKTKAEKVLRTRIRGQIDRTYEVKKDRPTAGSLAEKDQQDTFSLIDQIVKDGNRNSLVALVKDRKSGLTDFTVSEDGIVFTKTDGTKTAPIPIGTEITAIDVGKLLASDLGLNAETYAQNSKLRGTETLLNPKVLKFESFKKPKKAYTSLSSLAVSVEGSGTKAKIIYATDLLKTEVESKMVDKANRIIDRAKVLYDNIPDIQVTTKDAPGIGTADIISITVNGRTFSNEGSRAENLSWLKTNLDRALKGILLSGDEVKDSNKPKDGDETKDSNKPKDGELDVN